MSSIVEKAKEIMARYRALLDYVDDEVATSVPELFENWNSDGSFVKGDKRKHNGILYKCLQNHTAQADWSPDVAPSLWVRIDDPEIEFPEWRQPTGSTDAYPLGAKVTYNGEKYVSTVENNVWKPDEYGWELYGEEEKTNA